MVKKFQALTTIYANVRTNTLLWIEMPCLFRVWAFEHRKLICRKHWNACWFALGFIVSTILFININSLISMCGFDFNDNFHQIDYRSIYGTSQHNTEKNETIEILHLNRKSLWNIFFGLKCDWQPWLNGCEWKLALKSTRYQNRSKIKGFLPDSLAVISFIFLPLIKNIDFFRSLKSF